MSEICEGCGARVARVRNERCSDCHRRLAHLREFLAGWFWHLRYRYVPVWITPAELDEKLSQRFVDGLERAAREAPVPPSVEVRRHASRQLANGATLVAVD